MNRSCSSLNLFLTFKLIWNITAVVIAAVTGIITVVIVISCYSLVTVTGHVSSSAEV